jgi:hypothetical protein
MDRWNIIGWLVCLTFAAALAPSVRSQDQPAPPGPEAQASPYLPITVEIDLDAIRGKLIQKIRLDKENQGLPALLGEGKTKPVKILAKLREAMNPKEGNGVDPPKGEAPVPQPPEGPFKKKRFPRIQKLVGGLAKIIGREINTEFAYQLWMEKLDLQAQGDVLSGFVQIHYKVKGAPSDVPRALVLLTDLTGEGTVRLPYTSRLKPGKDGGLHLEGLSIDVDVLGNKGVLQTALENEVLQTSLTSLREQVEKRMEENVPDEFNFIKRLLQLNEPKSVGENRWLILNMKEILVAGVQGQGPGKRMIVRMAGRLEPIILVSKEKPEPPPAPRLVPWGKTLPAVGPEGVPLEFLVRIDPRAVPEVLPEAARKEVAKYGLDFSRVTLSQQNDAGAEKILITAPLQNPVKGLLKVWFTPSIKDNVLTFVRPGCEVVAPPAPKGKKVDATAKALEDFSRQTASAFVVAKLATTKLDFAPHLKKALEPPPGEEPLTGKMQVPLTTLRVVGLAARDNQLLVAVSGRVAPEGIRLQEP